MKIFYFLLALLFTATVSMGGVPASQYQGETPPPSPLPEVSGAFELSVVRKGMNWPYSYDFLNVEDPAAATLSFCAIIR